MKQWLGVIFFAPLLILAACGGSPVAKYNNAGNENYEAEDYSAAVDDYITAQREDPDLAEPYYNAGNAFHQQGNLESAAMQGKQAVREAEGELAQNSYYNLGNTYFKGQGWSDAIDAYKEALRLNPNDEEAKYNLELALQQQQQQQQEQQQGGGSGQQQQPGDNPDQQQQPSQGEGDEEQPDGGGGQPEQDDSGQSGSPDENEQPQQPGGPRGLTPQEAEQLLDALGQDSQTLKERLQEDFFAPGRPPAQDW